MVELTLNQGHLTPYGWSLVRELVPLGLIAGSIGNAVELKVLDHLTNQTSYTMPTPYLGLWTSAIDDSSTAASSGELTYTTYARQALSGTNLAPATGTTAVVTNDVAITFPAVSAGGGTVTHFMLCSSSSGAGDNIYWGTLSPSVVISTVATPPTIAIGALVIGLD